MGSSIRKVENRMFCVPEIIPDHYLIHLDLLYPHITIGKRKTHFKLGVKHSTQRSQKSKSKSNKKGQGARYGGISLQSQHLGGIGRQIYMSSSQLGLQSEFQAIQDCKDSPVSKTNKQKDQKKKQKKQRKVNEISKMVGNLTKPKANPLG